MFNCQNNFRLLRTIGIFSGLLLAMLATGPMVLAQDAEKPPKGASLWQPGDTGERLSISGWVRSIYGEPIAGAVVHIRQADGHGQYQDNRYRASVTTDAEGKYGFGTVLPGQYYGVKHIHVLVTHEKYQALETEILFADDPNLDPSTQRDNVVFLEQASVEGEMFLFGRFDIVLQPL